MCVEIHDAAHKKELIDYFNFQWNDNDKLVQLCADFEQQKITGTNDKKLNAQQAIYNYLQKQL